MRRFRSVAAATIALLPAQAFAITYSVRGLGDLPGGSDYSQAYGINDAGQVVGQSDAATGYRAFVWDAAGGMQDLGDLPGGNDYSQAFGINDAGQVVGFSGAATGNRAFLWDPSASVMQDLNDLIDPLSGWILADARGINARGQIVGYGTNAAGNTEAFLLTPVSAVPGPAPIFLIAGAFAIGGLLLRRSGSA